ncbi:MAG: hypothetical protein HYV28_13510, partial [Ignavibacteriales bacterium]|nr:hypothetical protein [Ignavibacteriales bacterium]
MQFTGFMDIPSWYMEYKEFSDTLLHRNAWFIKIRYAAALLLTILISALFVVASTANSIYLFMLALSPGALILLANIILDIKLKKHADTWDYRRLLNFALLQVITDLTAIAMLVYITGGVESVLSLLFVFHIIISALLFPARLVVWVSASVVAFYNAFAWLECSLLIPHFNLWLLLPTSLFNNPLYVLLNTVIFSGVMCMSALLAYRIAADMISQQKALYDLYQKLELAESQKQQYVIAIVHEIKQPVTAVTSFLELVTQNVLGEVPKEIATVLQKCIARNKEAVVMIN